MALEHHNKYRNLMAGILILVLASIIFQPASAFALGEPDKTNTLPNFTEFSRSVQNGQADQIRGVYIPGQFALPVVQQPVGNPGYVSGETDQVTQFRMADQYGNVGLLAHNYLSGQYFFNLKPGDEVRLVHGDGKVEYFVVTEILQYQALQPLSPYSSFRDLQNDQTVSVDKVFKRVFLGDHHVSFQTCIEKDGKLSWGRLFVIAMPKVDRGDLPDLMNIR